MAPPIPVAARSGTLSLTVHAVTLHDDVPIAVAYATDDAGDELAIAIRTGLARDLRSALRLGERPIIEADRHAVLIGFPSHPTVRVTS